MKQSKNMALGKDCFWEYDGFLNVTLSIPEGLTQFLKGLPNGKKTYFSHFLIICGSIPLSTSFR